MAQPSRLVVLDMTVSGTLDMGALSAIVAALGKHRQIASRTELDEYLKSPSGVAVAIPQYGSGFDLAQVRQLAGDSGLAVQYLTLDIIQKRLEMGKTVRQVVEELGL